MNPYRAIEYTLLGLLAVTFSTMVAWAITVAEGWHVVGWIITVIIGIILWCSFVGWWKRRRDAWDKVHGQPP
jgi:hypothetical protein